MRKAILFCTIFFSQQYFLYGQKETYNWHFARNCHIDFTSGTPVNVPGSQIMLSTHEGCATISDGAGNLLFYTDGSSVWNQNDVLMPNGTGLFGNYSSTQGAVIVPIPGNNTEYYIFTLTEYGSNIDLHCSVVRMSLNNGLGDVTQLNILIADSMSEKQIVVRHANGTDYWLITHNRYNNEFQSYLISTSGISLTPVRSSLGTSASGSNSIGCMKASRSGNKISCAYWSPFGTVEMYDFNKSTGVVSNVYMWQLPNAYGVEFSPNENYLYASVVNSNVKTVNQFDVLTPTNTPQLIYNGFSYHGDLLLAPDGKIYINQKDNNYLGVINYPDSEGVFCGYVENGFYLGTTTPTGSLGLPNMIHDMITFTGIKELSQDPEIIIFPSLVQNFLTISADHIKQNYFLIELFNAYGQKVKVLHSETPTNGKLHETFDLSDLSKGVYFVIVHDRSTFSKRFIKL